MSGDEESEQLLPRATHHARADPGRGRWRTARCDGEVMAAGCDDCDTKPNDLTRLLEKMEKFWGKDATRLAQPNHPTDAVGGAAYERLRPARCD